MKIIIAAAALLLAASITAHAEPKTITLDGCAKVEQETRKDNERTTITVKCTGEAFDPEVRKSQASISNNNVLLVGPNTCLTAEGKSVRC